MGSVAPTSLTTWGRALGDKLCTHHKYSHTIWKLEQ